MKRGQKVTAKPGGACASGSVMSKEDKMLDSYKQQKSDSLRSLPAESARRGLPGRGGLPGIAAAAGLALLLSACGGGGAGAPNSGAALGGSASSIQAAAAMAPAPVAPTPVAEQATQVAKQTTPVARKTSPGTGKTPPPNSQAEAPQPPKTPPDAEETPPPVVETIPPLVRESPAPPTARNIVTNPSTFPFPSGTDETVDINTFGLWGLPDYQPGGSSAAKNNGPKVVVRRRVGHSVKALTLPVSGGTGVFAYTHLSYGVVGINDVWLTYPADAAGGDLAVHIRTKKAKTTPTDNYKTWVLDWLEAAAELGPYYGFTVEDFFLTEAYLQAPGSGVQPAARGSETSATWTGKVIAVDSAANRILTRGTEIGGDAAITVNFGSSLTVDVSLTDLRSARAVSGAIGAAEPNGGFPPARYPSQNWTGLALAGGGFSDTSGGRSIEGAFRNQGTTTKNIANTVGGIFDVFGTMKGGFVATLPLPGPF